MLTERIERLVIVALAVCGIGAIPVRADLIQTEASLVGYWMLDEASGSSTVADSSSGGNTGNVVGSPTLGAGSAMPLLGTAAEFNGNTANRISVPYSAALNPSQVTIEAWAQANGGAGSYRSPMTSRVSSPTQGVIFYAAANNEWEFWSGTGGSSSWAPIGDVSVVTGQWVHLAGTHDGTTKTFYMNGSPVASTAAAYVAQAANPLIIGSGGDTGGSFAMNGRVDNVAVFNQALGHQKIMDHYNSFSRYATAVKNDAPQAYWRLGEQSDPDSVATGFQVINAMDVSAHTGQHQNGVSVRQIGDGPLGSDIDTYSRYTHTGSVYTSVPFDTDLNPVNFTVEAWARVEGSQGTYRAVVSSRGQDTGPAGYILYAQQDNNWSFWTGNGSSWDQINGPAVELDQWVHLVATFEATSGPDINGAYTGTKSLYIDGQLYASLVQKYLPEDANELRIGAGRNESSADYIFNGGIDEVAIYDYALTSTQVAAHYVTAVPTPAALPAGLMLISVLAARRRRA